MGDNDLAETEFELCEPVQVRASFGQWVGALIKGLLVIPEPMRERYQHRVIDRTGGHVIYQVTTDNSTAYRAARKTLGQDLKCLTRRQFLRKYAEPEPTLISFRSRRVRLR